MLLSCSLVAVGAGATNDDLVGIDRDLDLAVTRPMLGVDGVVLDRSIEPEAVAVFLAMVEGRLELAPAAPAATTAASASAAGS